FSSRRRHTRCYRDWSSDVCSSDLHRNTRPTVKQDEEDGAGGAGSDESSREEVTGAWDEYFDDDRRWGDVEAPRTGRDELPSLEQTMTKTASLEDHLVSQLALASLDRTEQDIGRSIIGNLEEDGYLRTNLEELASAQRVSLIQR